MCFIRKTLRTTIAIVGLGLAGAILATPEVEAKRPDSSRQRLEEDLRDRGLDPERVTIPFVLTPEMREFAHRVAPKRVPRAQKLERLLAALLDESALELQYSWGYTGTAAEVFETGRANCLAFTNLFLGLAREVGVPVAFYVVPTETYRRDRGFVIVSDHVAVGFQLGRQIRIFDFSEDQAAGDLSRARPIDDLYAIAMFYSNRGAEALQRGETEAAIQRLEIAIALKPELPKSWVNFGVALRRAGNPEGAEAAYRRALQIDPGTYSAYQNLATLLYLSGRSREAREFWTALENSPSRNPFSFITLGDISLRQGRLEEARQFYRRAANMDSSLAESFAALGRVAAADGDLKQAKRFLRKAQRIDTDNQRTVALAKTLAAHPG